MPKRTRVRLGKDSTMRVGVELVLEMNHESKLPRRELKKYLEAAIEKWKTKKDEDPLRNSISMVKVMKVQTLGSLHDVRSLGGKARAASLTAEKRSAIARRAAKARWTKK